MKRTLCLTGIFLATVASAPPALAFCGFYVAKADSKLFNKASKVVLVRDGDRSVLTMANDYQGTPKEFALVVPVPTFLERDQIHVADPTVIDHLDAYSAPRLVEYHDSDPCRRAGLKDFIGGASSANGAPPARSKREQALGVTIEARYTVGEYDIVLLSAKESSGLATWLTENGYRIPKGAGNILGSYIKQNLRFFVAKVNLAEQAKLGFTYLRPIQVAYESPKFMLPIRLGMVNANGSQELFIFGLTRKGRVETTNYRTVRLPSDVELPVFLKQGGEFSRFYRDMFSHQVKVQNNKAVFLEYAWDMAWCDPCAADPLSSDELRELGVFWMDGGARPIRSRSTRRSQAPNLVPNPQDVFLTRLHVRYDNDHFPEDLVFQETGDRANYQGRYILRHAWSGTSDCQGVAEYRKQLHARQISEAETLAGLTGWKRSDINHRIKFQVLPAGDGKWWKRLWKD